MFGVGIVVNEGYENVFVLFFWDVCFGVFDVEIMFVEG